MAARHLAGKVALVTGSTSGIGQAIATALGAAGADLVVHGLVSGPAEVEALTRKFKADTGSRVVVGTHNVAKAEELEALVALATATYGRVDILVNNAGIQHVSPIETFPPSKWDDILAINLTSCFHLMRHTLPGMRQRKFGRIINIASVHGLVASAHKSAYVAAKHGLVGLTKAVALETAGSGVTCNAICPGWVLTPLVQAQIDKRARETGKPAEVAKRELLLEKQPSGEFVRPEDLGALAVTLASAASAQITGVALPMDGGWTAQ